MTCNLTIEVRTYTHKVKKKEMVEGNCAQSHKSSFDLAVFVKPTVTPLRPSHLVYIAAHIQSSFQ